MDEERALACIDKIGAATGSFPTGINLSGSASGKE